MKTSLLLIGLLAGVGIVGTAQAAGATECTHSLNLDSHALAGASSVRHGMLSEVTDMVSEHLAKNENGRTASSGSGAGGPTRGGPDYPGQPGPASAPATAARSQPGNDTRHDSSAPMDMHAENNTAPAPASSDNPPTLGWQSLLPGSIQ